MEQLELELGFRDLFPPPRVSSCTDTVELEGRRDGEIGLETGMREGGMEGSEGRRDRVMEGNEGQRDRVMEGSKGQRLRDGRK